jgi:hypothetical protein
MSLKRPGKCNVFDGNEFCCLPARHPSPHMGRWYTMKQEDIEAAYERDRDTFWDGTKFGRPTKEDREACRAGGLPDSVL